MQIHLILVDSVEDYEQNTYVESAHFSKETAQKRFEELRKIASDNWPADEYDIESDSDTLFSAGKDGYYAQDHYRLELVTVEAGKGEWLGHKQSAIESLQKELKADAESDIRKLLERIGTNNLDFSLLVDCSDDEENSLGNYDEAWENRVNIDRWSRHDFWYSVYPKNVKIDSNGKLSFTCVENNDEEREEELDVTDMTAENLADIARMLYAYFDCLDEKNIEMVKEDGAARFGLKH